MNTLGTVAMILMLGNVVVHVALAIAVWSDSNELQRQGQRLAFFGPPLWTMTVIISGIVAAGFYWIIHHSTISRLEQRP